MAGALVALTVAGGCGGGSSNTGPTVPPPPAQGFSIAASANALSVVAGTNGALTVTLTRTGSFTGSVSLSAAGLPTGVTASFNPTQIGAGQTTSTLTLTTVAAVAAGTTTITVTGTATGLTAQTISVQLTITAAPQAGPFTLSISASSYLLLPTTHLPWSPIITITRNPGFTGPLTFSVSGLPPTLFIGMTPTNVTGNTVTLLPLSVGATANGTYTATIRGTAAGLGAQSVTLQLVVAPTSTGNIRWKHCSTVTPRYFFAVKDGTGPWTRVVPSTDSVYSFTAASATAQVAEVALDSGGFRTTIHQFTAQEMAARAASQCQLYPNGSTRTASGSFAGVTGFRTSQVGMGYWFGSANGNRPFSLLNLPAGPLDVVAVRNGELLVLSAISVDRAIIRRGVNPASGASMPVFDFTAAESFAPTLSTWTFGNVNGEMFGVSQLFTTAGGSTGIFTALPAIDGAPNVRTVYGIPLAQTLAGDLHQVIATVSTNGQPLGSPNRATRQIVTYARTIGDRSLSFGPPMAAATVTSTGGRLRAQGTLPAEYNAGVTFDVSQTTTARFATIHATRGFLGAGVTYDLQLPDLTTTVGWDSQFAIRPGIATNWWVSGGGPTLDFFDGRYIFNSTRSRWAGALTGIQAPADGATYLMARTVGATIP
ncbi:MAG: hypothetical protein ACT4P7_23520 [Gemmatimonadaceae bacterium]